MNETVLWEETIQPGASWSHVLKRGTALRVTDLEGGANVGGIFYNFECPTERYNMPDTLKAQHIARLTKGFVLYSDMGRVLLSVTGDSVGWHDPIGGASNRTMVEAKYGRFHLPGRTATTITRTVATVSWWSSASGDSVPAIWWQTSTSSAASMSPTTEA